MRVFGWTVTVAVGAAFVATSEGSLMPRTRGSHEFSPEYRRLVEAVPTYKFDGAHMLNSILDMNGSGAKQIGNAMRLLETQAPSLTGSEDDFNDFFDTFFTLKSMPGYRKAIDEGANFADPSTRSKVLTDSLNQMADTASKLLEDSTSKGANGLTGAESKMSSFYTSKDENVQALLAEHKQGNPDALPTLQQLFFDKHYGKGNLDVEALKSDEFIATQRDLLANDELFQFFVDDVTKDAMFDESLGFLDNLGHVDPSFLPLDDLQI